MNATALEHQQQIERLKQSIGKKRMKLEARQRELGNLHKYTEFLEKVVSNSKDVDDSQKNTIDTLKDRFTNLKNENKKLN